MWDKLWDEVRCRRVCEWVIYMWLSLDSLLQSFRVFFAFSRPGFLFPECYNISHNKLLCKGMKTNRRLLLYSGNLSHVRWWPLEKCLLQAVVVDTVVLLKSWPQAQSIILWLMSICYPQPWVTIHICSVKEICTEGHLFCFVFFIKHHLKTLTVSQMCPSATPTVTHWNSIFCILLLHYLKK